MIEEIWKEIPNTNGFYSVSNLGLVKSNDRYVMNSIGVKRFYKGQILKFSKSGWGGYSYVQLVDYNGNRYRECVHRIVARTFIPNPKNKPQVNHIDGDKNNNRLCNLEWCTPSENIQHAYDNGLTRIKTGKESPNYGKRGVSPQSKKVIDINTGKVFVSLNQAAESIGVPRNTLGRWLEGRGFNKSSFKFID